MIHRSSPFGFKPVLDALSTMLEREFIFAYRSPSFDINPYVYEYVDFKEEAMKELIKAIKNNERT